MWKYHKKGDKIIEDNNIWKHKKNIQEHRTITWSATAYKSAMIQGRQQQTAIPMIHAKATQKTTKNTSKPKNMIHNLQFKPHN